jgi:hypothetical protein
LKRFQRFELSIRAHRRLGILAARRLAQDKAPRKLGRLSGRDFTHKICRLVDARRQLASATGDDAILAAQADSNLGLVLENTDSDVGSEPILVETRFHLCLLLM